MGSDTTALSQDSSQLLGAQTSLVRRAGARDPTSVAHHLAADLSGGCRAGPERARRRESVQRHCRPELRFVELHRRGGLEWLTSGGPAAPAGSRRLRRARRRRSWPRHLDRRRRPDAEPRTSRLHSPRRTRTSPHSVTGGGDTVRQGGRRRPSAMRCRASIASTMSQLAGDQRRAGQRQRACVRAGSRHQHAADLPRWCQERVRPDRGEEQHAGGQGHLGRRRAPARSWPGARAPGWSTPSTSPTPPSSWSARPTTPTPRIRWPATSRSSTPPTSRIGPRSGTPCRASPPGPPPTTPGPPPSP